MGMIQSMGENVNSSMQQSCASRILQHTQYRSPFLFTPEKNQIEDLGNPNTTADPLPP